MTSTDLPLDSYSLLASSTEPAAPPVPTALWGAVADHQRSIERLLEQHFSGRDPGAWPALLDAISTLERWHEQSRDEVQQLLASTPQAQPVSNAPAGYRQASLKGAMAEARVQHLLGTLLPGEYTIIDNCFKALLEGRELPDGHGFARFELADSENRSLWSGAVILEAAAPLTEGATVARVMMYRFGAEGGWSFHDSRDAVVAAATTALGALPEQQVRLVPGSALAFDDALDDAVAMLTGLLTQTPSPSETRERVAVEALDQMTVPVNPPRLLALARVEEIRRSLQLGEQANAWLSRLPAQVRGDLARLVTEYADAIVRSDAILRRDLPAPTAYAAIKVSEYLTTCFSLTQPCRIQVKLPQTVSYITEVISGSGAPGVPGKRIARPSTETELVSLEDLALRQIDDDLDQRLAFMEVQVSPAGHPQHDALIAGIDKPWLRRVLPELDVAGKYERLLADVYLRAGQFQDRADETEVLIRPFALTLEMHRVMALHQGRINAQGVEMIERASRAVTADAWRSGDMALTLRPAALTLFDERTHSAGSTLAGVTFIHDSLTGTTLLYLPKAPDGRCFSQHESLGAAVEALADLFVDERMRRYLCGQAIEGDPRQLESLVNQALARGFRNVVSTRGQWPDHHSLAHNQYLAELGLAVSDHRAYSTSNADRRFADAISSRAKTVGYIRLALGFVPFVGSVIALLDALEAGIEAGNAFADGNTQAGLEATESVLLSIVDALFDFGPAAVAGASSSASLMATARARQLRRGLEGAGRLRQLAGWSTRRADEAFTGYERPVSLTSTPGKEGRWRGIYREQNGHFITRGSHVYAVDWDESLRTWRLAATRTRSYRQPIALDEAGRWQTHGHLYGSLVEGGLRGGGGLQSYIADRLDPLWPDTLRRLLPRWWADAHFRRQHQLFNEQTAALTAAKELEAAVSRTVAAYNRGEVSVERVFDGIERMTQSFERVHSISEQCALRAVGRRATEARISQSLAAAGICDKAQLEIKVLYNLGRRLTNEGLQLHAETQLLVQRLPDQIALNDPIMQQLAGMANNLRKIIARKLECYDRIDQSLTRLRFWNDRFTIRQNMANLSSDIEEMLQTFNAQFMAFMRINMLLDITSLNNLTVPSWLYMHRLYRPARARFDRAAIANLRSNLRTVPRQQRERIRNQLREISREFIATLQRLLASYPEHFDLSVSDRLLAELRTLHEGLALPQPPRTTRTRVQGQQDPQVFEGDGLVLVGRPEPREPNVLIIDGINDQQERWVRNAQRRWVPVEPPAPPQPRRSLAQLVSYSRARLEELPAFRERLRQYARQQMIPAALEDLYLGEASELEFRITELLELDQRNAPQDLIHSLQHEADRLRVDGQLARIAQCKASTKPTGGYLEYLINMDEVNIRKLGDLLPMRAKPGERSFLQEYEIVDRQTGEVWCYAHFHYDSERPRFANFTAAHLKNPQQRFQRDAAAGQAPIWRGEISRRLANELFRDLF